MAASPLRCPTCGSTDFFVLSTDVSFTGGALVETYTWPEREDEVDGDSPSGYQVEQDFLRDPEVARVDGPVRALCAVCLQDLTEPYLKLGRAESLPV